MHDDAEYAGTSEPRHLSELDEIKRCGSAHERKYDRVVAPRSAEQGLNFPFDDRTREIVEGMLAFPPPRVVLGVAAKPDPQCAAAIGDHNDRFRFRIQCRSTIPLRDDRVVTMRRHGRDKIQTKRLARTPDCLNQRTHAAHAIL